MLDITIVNAVLRQGKEKFIPIGPLSIASILEENGYNVKFFDYQTAEIKDSLDPNSFLSYISTSSQIIGIGCYFNLLPTVLLAIEQIKSKYPEKIIILGGPGPSSVAKKILENFKSVDIIVIGEGEETIIEVMSSLKDQISSFKDGLKNVKGIAFRDHTGVHVNPPRPRINDLDSLPLPAYSKISFKDYTSIGIMSSRGCPLHCSFCAVAPLWGNTNRERSLNNILQEIKTLYEIYGIEYIRFADDLFVLNKNRVKDFCYMINRDLPNIKWACMGRIDYMNDEMIRLIAKSGCIGIQYGVESGSEYILKRINKPFSLEKIKNVLIKSVKHLDHVISTFIWGFPFESLNHFYETIYFMSYAAEIGSSIKLLHLMPTSLSKIYVEYKDKTLFSNINALKLLTGMSSISKGILKKKHIMKILYLIEKYPNIFPDFYYYYSEDLENKISLLEKKGWLYS